MPLTILHVGGPHDGLEQHFGPDVESITIGRDPERCQVVLDPEARMAGREHCTLTRVRGRYLIDMAPDRVVTLADGTLLDRGAPIPDVCELTIGPNGPRLRVTVRRHSGLASTADQGMDPDVEARRAAPAASVVEVEHAASTAASSNRKATLVGALTLLVLIGVTAAILLFSRDVERLEEQDATHGQRIAGVEGRADIIEDDLVTLGAKLPELLATAQPSVYLVVHRGAEGGETAFGTAFVAAEDRLATNAHIAAMYDRLAEGESLLLRSTAQDGRAPIDIPVTGTTAHPGYDAFSELWRGYVPVRLNAANSLDAIRPAGTACDLALLHVADGTDLPAPLPLASEASHEAMRPGHVVGSVGFPMEGMALEGVNLTAPVAQMQVGRITALTTFFNTSEDETDSGPGQRNTLIQHSISGTGGASGSPILNGHGEVVGVVSAVNFAIVDGTRIPTGAGVNFAQRSTLLDELLDASAADALAARLDAWTLAVRRLYYSGDLRRESAGLDTLVNLWRAQFIDDTPPGKVAFTSTLIEPNYWPLDSLHAARRGSGNSEDGFATDVVIDMNGGSYYLIAASSDGAVDADLAQALADGSIEDVRILQIGEDTRGWAFRAGRTQQLTVALSSDAKAGEFGTTVMGGHRTAATEGQALAAIRQQWRQALRSEWGRHVRDIGGFVQAGTTADTGGDESTQTLSVPFDRQGVYLVAATSEAQDDLDLRIYLNSGEDRILLGEDLTEDGFPFIAFEVYDAVSLDAEVASASAGTPFDLHIYRAIVRGDADASDVVDIVDLMMTVQDYGTDCTGGQPCGSDVDEDGVVGINDVLDVLADYGLKSEEAMASTLFGGSHLALQSMYSEHQYALRSMGVGNHAWCAHGSALLAGSGTEMEDFLSTSYEDIRAQFADYVDRKALTPGTTDLVILDIEKPVQPREFGSFIEELEAEDNMELFGQYIDAFRRRIQAAREVLPNARIAMYGVIVPHSWGDPDLPSQQKIMSGYWAAEEHGFYDDADILVPIIYQRFGPDDNKFDRLDDYTILGWEEANDLRRSDGSSIPVVPMTTFKIYNGGSPYTKTPVEPENLLYQVNVLRDLGVHEFLFWNGKDEIKNYDETVVDRLRLVLEEAASPSS